MSPFVQPPFWSRSPRAYAAAPHAVSLVVTPAVPIVTSSIAAATVIETATPHAFVSGDTATIAGHVGSTPALDGARVVTVIDATHVSVPVTVTVSGAGGTITRTIARQPLTLAQGKLRAGLDWVDGDPRDELMTGFIAAAASKVEQDTGLALFTQTRDIYLDSVQRRTINLPAQSRPLQAVTSIKSTDTAGTVNTLDPSNYVVDFASGRIGLSVSGVWPIDLRYFQPWVIRIVSGWPSQELLAAAAPGLVHAVGLMTAHYATAGRDVATIARGTPEEMPFGYEDAIAPYRLVVVA